MLSKSRFHLFFFLFCILFISTLRSQKTFHAILVDSLSRKPINSANILYDNNGSGTITNMNGEFQLFLNKERSKQMITISHIAYESRTIWVDKNKDTILLVPKRYELKEVVIINLKKLLAKVIAGFINKNEQNKYCEEFFYKQFLRENEKYVNYLEAIGVTQIMPNGEKDIYIKDKRATDNLIEEYLNFHYASLNSILKRASIDIIKNGEIVNHLYLNENTLKITLKTSDNNQEYFVFLNLSDNSILKISKNTINNQSNKKLFTKSIRVDKKKRELDYYLQGELFEFDFKKIKERYYINKIYFKGKGTLSSRDNEIKLIFLSEQIYLVTGFKSDCNNLNDYTKIRVGKKTNIAKIKNKKSIINWNLESRILPVENEVNIFKELEWKN